MGKDVLDDRYGRMFETPLEFSRQGLDVSCFSLSYRNRGYCRRYLNPHLEWTSIDFNIAHPNGLYRIIRAILNHVRISRPASIVATSDIIHLGIGSYISHKTGVPLISDIYDNFESYGMYKFPFMQTIYRNALKKSRAVTCVSKPLSEYIEKYCNKACTIEVVENAVDHSVFKPMPKIDSRRKLSLPVDAILIGTAGALSEGRDIGTLYHAYKLLLSKGSDIHLVLAGRHLTKIQIPDYGNIHYLGELDHNDIPYFYNALDLAIVPLTDSAFGRYCFPQKACEILACKRPLVSSSAGIMKDLLKDYPECLFDDGNVEMLVERILGQLKRAVVPDILVPDWSDQARKIKKLIGKVNNNDIP